MANQSIEGFVRLNDITSLHEPSQSNGHTSLSSSPSNGPSLIVLCSWMGAQKKHIAKYTTGYRTLYPGTPILLIESTMGGITFGPDLSAAITCLAPYAKAAQSSDPRRGKVLLSLSSNGGATNACHLATALREKYGAVPFDALILDCTPSRGSIENATKAFAFSLPKQPVIRFVGWYLIYASIIAYVAVVQTFGIEDMAAKFLRILNDPAVFSTKARRLYMYSKKDELVLWEHVERHAEEARAAGYSVREEVFDTAPHCALINEDSGRYWGAVRTHVEDGMMKNK